VPRVKAKKPCCKSDPRCKRCPVVLQRLEKAGYAERVGRRRYVVGKVPKKVLKAARG
jgi:predicted transcriptional regulator of viral defense system